MEVKEFHSWCSFPIVCKKFLTLSCTSLAVLAGGCSWRNWVISHQQSLVHLCVTVKEIIDLLGTLSLFGHSLKPRCLPAAFIAAATLLHRRNLPLAMHTYTPWYPLIVIRYITSKIIAPLQIPAEKWQESQTLLPYDLGVSWVWDRDYLSTIALAHTLLQQFLIIRYP